MLNDVGWSGGGGGGGVTSPETNNKPSQHSADRRIIPLKMCYLCRNLAMPDPQRKLLEIHSPDAKHSCILRCPDEHIASQWFNAIHSNIHILTQIALTDAHSILSNSPNTSTEIKMMGWVAEQVSIKLLFDYFPPPEIFPTKVIRGKSLWHPILWSYCIRFILEFVRSSKFHLILWMSGENYVGKLNEPFLGRHDLIVCGWITFQN